MKRVRENFKCACVHVFVYDYISILNYNIS